MTLGGIAWGAIALSAVRILIGLVTFVPGRFVWSLFRFPLSADSPTARLLARMFGIREAALGVFVLLTLTNLERLHFAVGFGAAIDLLDAVPLLAALLGRQGIDEAAKSSLGTALGVFAVGTTLWWLTRQ